MLSGNTRSISQGVLGTDGHVEELWDVGKDSHFGEGEGGSL